jgi:hypothetical protein
MEHLASGRLVQGEQDSNVRVEGRGQALGNGP